MHLCGPSNNCRYSDHAKIMINDDDDDDNDDDDNNNNNNNNSNSIRSRMCQLVVRHIEAVTILSPLLLPVAPTQ